MALSTRNAFGIAMGAQVATEAQRRRDEFWQHVEFPVAPADCPGHDFGRELLHDVMACRHCGWLEEWSSR